MIKCQPDYDANSYIFPNGYTSGVNAYGARTYFYCNYGYHLVGDPYLVCESDGSDNDGYGAWDNVEPSCERTYNRCNSIRWLIAERVTIND